MIKHVWLPRESQGHFRSINFALTFVNSVHISLPSTFTTLRRSLHKASPGLSSTISFFIRHTKPVLMAVVSPEIHIHEHFQIQKFNFAEMKNSCKNDEKALSVM